MPIKSWDRETKKCSRCKEEKLLVDFHNSKVGFLGKQGACKLCQRQVLDDRRAANPEHYNKLSSLWKKKNPEKTKASSRNAALKRTYGISSKDYAEMLEAQGFSCALCQSKEPCGVGRFHVDHCHTTGKVRGLLCHYCNIGLGHFKESAALLERAIEYLRVTKESKDNAS